MAYLADRRTAGDPLPIVNVRTTLGGNSFTAGRRTVAHLEWTIQQLEDRHPSYTLRVIQGCYNVGVAASAGTHDKDGCLDVEIVGMAWLDAQRFLRECGWAAWWRYPPTFGNHVHMVSLGCPGPVGVYVPGQVDDYYAHRTGLAGHVADDTWHPADIDASVFDYPAWLEAQDMTPEEVRQIVREEIGNYKVDVGGASKVKLPALLARLWERTKN